MKNKLMHFWGGRNGDWECKKCNTWTTYVIGVSELPKYGCTKGDTPKEKKERSEKSYRTGGLET